MAFGYLLALFTAARQSAAAQTLDDAPAHCVTAGTIDWSVAEGYGDGLTTALRRLRQCSHFPAQKEGRRQSAWEVATAQSTKARVTQCATTKVRPLLRDQGAADAGDLEGLERRTKAIWSEISKDRECERSAFEKAPPPGFKEVVEPVLKNVTKLAQDVTGEHYWRWSEALDPSVAYAFYIAVKTAAETAGPADSLDFLEIGSNWGSSLVLVAQLIRAIGKEPGVLLSVDPYAPGGAQNEGWHNAQQEYLSVAAEVREKLRQLPPELVLAEEQRELDAYTRGENAEVTVNMVAARALYRMHDLNVTHIRGTSEAILPKLLERGGAESFHIVSVDGLHDPVVTMSDTVYALALLRRGGIMIQDDVFSGFAARLNSLACTRPQMLLHSTWKNDVYISCGLGETAKHGLPHLFEEPAQPKNPAPGFAGTKAKARLEGDLPPLGIRFEVDTWPQRSEPWQWPRAFLGMQQWQDMDIAQGKLGRSSLALSGVDALRLVQDPAVPSHCDAGGTSGPTFAAAVNFSDAELPLPPFTLVVRIRPSSSGSEGTFLGWSAADKELQGVEFRSTAEGNLEYGELSDAGWHSVLATPAVNLTANNWHTVAATRTAAGQVTLFVGGRQVGVGTVPAAIPVGLARAVKSARTVAGHNDMVFQGDVAMLRTYTAALSLGQLRRLSEEASSSSSTSSTSVDCPFLLPRPIYCDAGGVSGMHFKDTVLFEHAALPRPPFTLSVRLRTVRAYDFQTFLGWKGKAHDQGIELRLMPDGNLEYGEGLHSWESVQASPKVHLADGAWHNIAVTRLETGWTILYVDGVPVGQGALPERAPTVRAGARSARLLADHNDYVTTGDITLLRIYNRPLVLQEVASLWALPCEAAPHDLRGVLLNVGASDSCLWRNVLNDAGQRVRFCDPVNEALELREEFPFLRGVLVDSYSEGFDSLRRDLKATNARVERGYASFLLLEKLLAEENVCRDARPLSAKRQMGQQGTWLLPEHKGCKELLIVKIDTDDFDCEMVEFLLSAGVRPRAWYLEVNPLYPPPIRYAYYGQVDPEHKWPPKVGKPGDTCSLSYLSDLLRPHRYDLVQLDWYNALYVSEAYSSAFGSGAMDDYEAYYHGWASRERVDIVLQWSDWAVFKTTEKWRHHFTEHMKKQSADSKPSTWHPEGRDGLLREAWQLARQEAKGDPFYLQVPIT
eukprot:TRINITY_DN21903_c0_g1_i1.p1 TRINITY_DN21903_c0_g1~~TRINITY_DN21903_c0_g1_i1.p1  ORF type:complete len:1183 (-),score=237.65 TRINITY_DN21903_c0_g1_i1:282-3830(-)